MTPPIPAPDTVTPDAAVIEQLEFTPQRDCELYGPCDLPPVWWLICRSCNVHVTSCDQHLQLLRVQARAATPTCLVCGRSYPNLEQGMRVEPIGTI